MTVDSSIALSDTTIGAPSWWLDKLETELSNRRLKYDTYRKAVDGEHDSVKGNNAATQRFKDLAKLSTTNLTGLVIEATAERMNIESIREAGASNVSDDAWEIWQDSNFDEWSQHAVTTALINGRSYLSVNTNGELAYEDSSQVVVAYSPTDNSPRAGLKVFVDEWTGEEFATLYLPNYVLKYADASADSDPQAPRQWVARPQTDEVVRNPLGRVPFWELQNRPLGKVRSEIEPLLVPQAALNQTMFNLQAISEYGAFRQKWATGVEIMRDPITNEPLYPFSADVTKMFLSENDSARFGDFNSTDMKPHIDLAREIAWHVARISRLPVSYFLTDVSNIGTDTLALLVSGLVSKCKRRILGYEPAFEDAIAFALQRRGIEPESRLEVVWAEMETRSMSQGADAALKLTSGQNPVITTRTAQEKFLNLTPEEIERDEVYRNEAQAQLNMQALLAATANYGAAQEDTSSPASPASPAGQQPPRPANPAAVAVQPNSKTP